MDDHNDSPISLDFLVLSLLREGPRDVVLAPFGTHNRPRDKRFRPMLKLSRSSFSFEITFSIVDT